MKKILIVVALLLTVSEARLPLGQSIYKPDGQPIYKPCTDR